MIAHNFSVSIISLKMIFFFIILIENKQLLSAGNKNTHQQVNVTKKMNTRQNLTRFMGENFYNFPGLETFELRPGLMLQITHACASQVKKTAFEIKNSPIIFGFMLEGLNHCHYAEGTLRNTTHIHSAGSNRITYLPDTVGSHEYKKSLHRLSIMATQEFLEAYLSQENIAVPPALTGALAEKKDAFQWAGQCSTQKMRIVSEVFTRVFSGSLRKLHMESRALELIEIQLSEYLSTDFLSSKPNLKTSDISRIKDAREILVQDMENPPSIAQLARLAGVNEKKLKYGFKQVFGVPVFEYFRNYRLEVARELLLSGIMNVTEIGISIGYRNLSHFSGEFKKKYGITPKKFQAGDRS